MRSENLPFEQAQELIRDHVWVTHHHLMAGPTPAQMKGEKLLRPSLKVKDNLVEEEGYKFVMHQWETYKAQANLTANAKQHLESCLDDEITSILFGRLGKEGWEALTEEGLLDNMKEVFMKRRNWMINRMKLRSLKKGLD